MLANDGVSNSKATHRILVSAGIISSSSEMRIEPKNIVPDLPNLRPFDFSFKPVPNLSTTNTPICPYSEIGIDVVVTKPLGMSRLLLPFVVLLPQATSRP